MKIIAIKLEHLEACKATRPAGYVEALQAAGTVKDNCLLIADDKLESIIRQYTPERISIRGLGDVVEWFVKPIANASDAVLKTKLVGCGSCAERRAKLNNAVPFNQTP